jgi:hypothetical protein
MKFVTDYVNYGELKCYDGDDCATLAGDMCNYMQDCNGNGSCSSSTGLCECKTGYFGADCSVQVSEFENHSTAMQKVSESGVKGKRWTYFAVPAMTNTELYTATIESISVPFDVYIRKGLSSIPD